MPEPADPSADLIRSRGFCTGEQVQEGLEIQQKMRDMGINPKPLAEILLDKGYLTKDQFREVSAKPLNEKGSLEKDSIPGYELLKKIGQGGMGAVFQAKQLSMDRIVALKVLPPKLAKDAQFRERFMREARAVAKLNHENIIQGIDVGTANGLYFFVMEFVDGQPLSRRLVDGQPLPEKEALSVCGQIARALEHAWRHKLVHRDVKPENIMSTADGVAKLCDLGLAKQETGDVGLTQAGLSVGTPNYISPEQARGEEDVDTRSDLYSLGASLYHMMTGKVPFDGTVPSVVMTKHITEDLVPPQKIRPELSAEANAIVLRAMQKRREDRYPDPGQMATDLEAAAAGKPLVYAKVPKKAFGPGPVAAGAPLAPLAPGETSRKALHSTYAAPPKTSAVIMPIAIATVVALVIVIGVVFATKGKKSPEKTQENTTASNTPVKPDNPTGTGTGTGPAIDVAAEREKQIEQEYKALSGFIEGNQSDPAHHADIESRLEEFIAAHKKTEWENKALADRKKFRDGLDGVAQTLLAKIRAEAEPIRKDGRAWEAYKAAQGKWMKHFDVTPTAKKFAELLAEIDAEMQAAWAKDRDAAKALQEKHDYAKAQAALDGVKKYASPQVVALADALRAEIKQAGEDYLSQLEEIGRRRHDAEFWPALEKLLVERKYKEGLTHCGKFLNDPEMGAVKDRILAMIEDVTSLNLLMGEAANGADAAIKSKEPVLIKKFEVRLTSRNGDRVAYAFLNGGSSEIAIPKASEEDLAVLCQLAFNTLASEQKATERGPFSFRIGLLFYFSADEKNRKRAIEELEKASKEGVARAKWYLDRLGEKTAGDPEAAAKKLYEEATDLFDKKKYAEARLKFQKLLSEMAATACVKERKATIQQKMTECDAKLGGGGVPGIQGILKGTVLKTYERSGAVEVIYDFSKDDQLQDWTSNAGTWNWDKDTQSLHGQAPEDALRGFNWNVPLVGDMSIDMKLTAMADRGMGITVHNDSNGHSYMALFGGFAPGTATALGNPDVKSLALLKINQGARTPFALFQSAADPKAARGAALHVRLTRAGKAISLYVEDKKVLSGEDDAFTRGQISLFLQGSEARFDDILIYGTPDPDWLKSKLPGGK